MDKDDDRKGSIASWKLRMVGSVKSVQCIVVVGELLICTSSHGIIRTWDVEVNGKDLVIILLCYRHLLN
jgi:hypothetical protein